MTLGGHVPGGKGSTGIMYPFVSSNILTDTQKAQLVPGASWNGLPGHESANEISNQVPDARSERYHPFSESSGTPTEIVIECA